jgi:tRNA(adenine34) deaminase
MASIWANIGRIVFGAGRGQVHEMYFEDRHLSTLVYIADGYKSDSF